MIATMRATRAIAILFLPLWAGACTPWTLDPAGRVAAQERTILLDSLAIMLAIVIPTILVTLAFAFWYRKGNTRARYLPDFAYSGRLELLVWSIPTLVILFLGGIIWTGSHDLDPAKPLPGTPLEIDVVAMDWKWLFLYPGQGIASINTLTVPVGQPLHFRITSASVFNSFFVPRLGSQIYAMPGMVADLNLEADRPETLHGLSAQFSGDGFSKMGFDLHAVPQQGFAAWVAQARKGAIPLDAAAYGKLLKPGVETARTYSAAAPGLFDQAIARTQGAAPMKAGR
jgi:cytochrome o ubiquinol oxidase subunit 2